MAELCIFDLQRFAVHDGPGIRTTVFLKGCPLDCIWCHNPESKKRQPQLGYLEKNCIGCRKCENACPNGVHSFGENGNHHVDFRRCTACGRCVSACPDNALKIFGTLKSPKDIMDIVVRDKDFYVRSDGGLTVSGGEPMFQFEGLLELLRLAKKEGIHVCLDTSGQASSEQYRAVSYYTDLFLFDYKITDPAEHRKYIGTDNRLIIKNLKMLAEMGKDIILRCPIIPGVNDNTEHLKAIAALSRDYSSIREVNLMTYHDMAKGKTAQIGETYALTDLKTIEEEEKRKLYEKAEALGCLKLGLA